MKTYNIYYKGQRLNRRPLYKDDIDIIMSQETVSKIVNSTKIKNIPVKDCKVVECTLL